VADRRRTTFGCDLERRSFVRLLSALPLLQLGCAARAPRPRGAPVQAASQNAREMAELGLAYEALMSEHGLHEWARYAGQEPPGTEPAAAMQSLRRKEHELVARAARLCAAPDAGTTRREAELWQRAHRGTLLLADPEAALLADRLDAMLNDFQFEHAGRTFSRGDLKRMARSADPAERRLQHRLMGELHAAAAPSARALLARRHALAEAHGLDGFYPALLELRGVDAARFPALLETLEARTRDAFSAALAEAQRNARLEIAAPYDRGYLWKVLGDYDDAAFPAEAALDFAHRIWGALGVDLEHPKLRIDVRDFAFGGQAISIRVPSDVRLVVSPSPGAYFYSTLLHELGHAFAATRTRVNEPVLKGYEWIAGLSQPGCDEGVAETFGDLLDEPGVMERFGPALARGELSGAQQGRRKAAILRMRWQLLAIVFEREALRDPAQDLDALERKLLHELLGLHIPPDLEPIWATSPFLATYPVYTQSYLLASLFSQQLRATLRARFGSPWLRPEAAAWLVENVVHDAAATTLDQKLVRATGSPLAPDAYLAYLSGG
jgi:tetratricopeptide (TPR) repeat protein